jgi:endonuclease/exonuclease/phosphatase family metal-dependent hydrolase
MEFFGRADAGPTNDALQTTNATSVIAQLAPDLIGLEEVCDTTDFTAVINGLASQHGLTYDAVLANDPTLGNAYSGYGGSWGQKTALLFKPSVATRVSAQLVYRTDLDGSWASTFASRDPLEVELRLNASGAIVYVIVVHLKAEDDTASYQQRVQASTDLKAYLDAVHPHDAVMVIGDWNDDLDSSITSGEPSPFTNFLDAPAGYLFATKPLSDTHTTTTDDHAGHPIDHHLITQPLFGKLIAGSATVLHPAVSAYSSTTSDHYPTLVRYALP